LNVIDDIGHEFTFYFHMFQDNLIYAKGYSHVT